MSLQHISEFVDLWTQIREVNLVEGTADTIIWKFTDSRECSAASMYKAQFEGMTRSYMMEALGKIGLPRNASFLCGSSYKTEFGRPTISKGVDGQIAGIASYVTVSMKPWSTYSSSAATRPGYGT
jgi:hypothetical protein